MQPARVLDGYYIFPTEYPDKFRAVLGDTMKHAVVRGKRICAAPCSVDSAIVLNNMGIRAPSPITWDYKWAGLYTPRWYQRDTAAFLTLNPRAFCFSAMRTGKTLSALWATDYLRTVKRVERTLIVAPLSTLWDVWEQALFESFSMRGTCCVLHGSRQRRIDLLSQQHDFYIVNYHGVQLIEAELSRRPDINHVIIDEISKYRNGFGYGRGKTLFRPLFRVLNSSGVARSAWGLTGTPTPNAPTDAVALSKLIVPERWGGSFTAWRERTMYKVGNFKWVPRHDSPAAVSAVLRPSIRHERAVATDMEPQMIYRRAELSKEQMQAYKQLMTEAITIIKQEPVTAVNAAVLLSKLVQVACGVVVSAGGKPVGCDFGPRYTVLEELIEENNEKVLVFVPFTGVIDALAKKLKKRWSVAVVDGRVSAKRRTEVFRSFRNALDPHVLVCHPEVMAHGLDLTEASLIIWYAAYTKAEMCQQANARIDGSRQRKKIDIAHIYATSEEKKILTTVAKKGRLQDVVLEIIHK